MNVDDLLEAWRVNQTVTMDLLKLCPDDTFEFKPGKGKTIRSNFTHIVNVRMSWADPKGLQPIKLDWKTAVRSDIDAALIASSERIIEYLTSLGDTTKARKWTAPKFLAYLVAHEANHRAQIEIALRINDRELTETDQFELWNWDKK